VVKIRKKNYNKLVSILLFSLIVQSTVFCAAANKPVIMCYEEFCEFENILVSSRRELEKISQMTIGLPTDFNIMCAVFWVYVLLGAIVLSGVEFRFFSWYWYWPAQIIITFTHLVRKVVSAKMIEKIERCPACDVGIYSFTNYKTTQSSENREALLDYGVDLNIEKCLSSVYKTIKSSVVLPNIYTEVQKGSNWSLIACLHAMFKLSGNRLTQEKIYEIIFKEEPKYWRKISFLKLFKNLFSTLSEKTIFTLGLSLTKKTAKIIMSYDCIDRDHMVEMIKKVIADFHNLIGREMFAIDCGFLRDHHFLNVTKLEEDYITFEDPLSGLSFTLRLEDFCKFCYDRHNREIFMISFNNQSGPLETDYYLNTESKNGIFKHSC
jgi:hypothetical protein